MTKELKPAHIVILENLNKLLWYPPDISQTDYRRVVKIELLLEILQKIKIEPDKEIVVVLKILANIWQKQKTNYEETIKRQSD